MHRADVLSTRPSSYPSTRSEERLIRAVERWPLAASRTRSVKAMALTYLFGSDWRQTIGWDQTEAAVRSTAVVMIDEDLERVLKMSRVQDQHCRCHRSSVS